MCSNEKSSNLFVSKKRVWNFSSKVGIEVKLYVILLIENTQSLISKANWRDIKSSNFEWAKMKDKVEHYFIIMV